MIHITHVHSLCTDIPTHRHMHMCSDTHNSNNNNNTHRHMHMCSDTDGHMDRQTNKQTDRQTDRQADKHTHTHTHTCGAVIRFISNNLVCRAACSGLLFFSASSKNLVHCWTMFTSMNTSTICCKKSGHIK